MRANRGRDTGPELAVRRALHARGLRYRVDHPLPFDRRRRADVAFTRAKVAVFIAGYLGRLLAAAGSHATVASSSRA